jgi:hypothetical protein
VLGAGEFRRWRSRTANHRVIWLVPKSSANSAAAHRQTATTTRSARICSSDETVGTSGPYTFSAYHDNLAGGLILETYPSNRVVTTTFDFQNRPVGVNSGSTLYVSALTYASSGVPSLIQLGPQANPIATETTQFDQGLNKIREQPTQLTVVTAGPTTPLTLTYSYSPVTLHRAQLTTATLCRPESRPPVD